VEPERDYLSICKRYSKLYVVPDFSKLIVCWIGKDVDVPLSLSIRFISILSLLQMMELFLTTGYVFSEL
jgi:hypothetical protein